MGKNPTIRSIARQAGVSPATISRVLNQSGYVGSKTRKKVEAAIKEMDYIPSALASGLPRNVSNVVGVVVPELSNSFFNGVIRGITEAADEKSLNIILCNTDEDYERERRVLRTLRGQRIMGLIMTPASEKPELGGEYVETLSRMGIPVVLIDRDIPGGGFDRVYTNDEAAVFDAVSLLIREGHRRIALLAGNPGFFHCRTRVDGFRRALSVAGIECDDSLIFYSKFTRDDGYQSMRRILSSHRNDWPTAVMSNNNSLTLGALKAIFELDLRIPDDIAFAGYDQIEELEILKANITMCEKDTREIGRVAMNLLHDGMQQKGSGERQPRHVVIMPKVVIRGSERLAGQAHRLS